jgi:hypothetical protein
MLRLNMHKGTGARLPKPQAYPAGRIMLRIMAATEI